MDKDEATTNLHKASQDKKLEPETVFVPAAEPLAEPVYSSVSTVVTPSQNKSRTEKTKRLKHVRFMLEAENDLLAENLRRDEVRHRRRKILKNVGVVAFHTRLAGGWWKESDSEGDDEADSDSDSDSEDD